MRVFYTQRTYNIRIRVAVLLLATLLGVVGLLWMGEIQKANAHTITPFLKEYLLEQRNQFKDSFLLQNEEEHDVTFNVSVAAYNPQNEQFEDGEIFVTPLDEQIVVRGGEEIEVPFEVEIPPKQSEGSYFNIIVVQEQFERGSRSENPVTIQHGFGIIIAMHVVEEGAAIKGAFIEKSASEIDVVSRGVPLLSPTRLNYKYVNNSTFLFIPEGEIRVFDQVTNERLVKERINPDKEKVYPGESFHSEYTFNLWEPGNIFHDLRVVSRTYSQFDDTYMEQIYIIKGLPQWSLYVAVGVLAFLTVVVIRGIKKRIRKTS